MAVTHLTGPAHEVLGSNVVDDILVTDSIAASMADPKIQVMSLDQEIGEAIQRMENARRRGSP